jgi:endonuclease YncB( thermonuclease family)
MRNSKLLTTLLLLISCNLFAATLQGKVVSVADGDTITVLDEKKNQHKIRLQGIDAPERDQAYGQTSKQSLSQLVFGQEVTIEVTKKDKYGRTIGKVLLNHQDICLEQVKRGLAWHYKQYQVEQSKDDQVSYAEAELTAKNQLIGLWKDKNATPPWEFRKR